VVFWGSGFIVEYGDGSGVYIHGRSTDRSF